jgi:hypothetical protein
VFHRSFRRRKLESEFQIIGVVISVFGIVEPPCNEIAVIPVDYVEIKVHRATLLEYKATG